MKLPKIKVKLNSTFDNEIFFTDTDDIGFARNILNQIDTRMRIRRELSLKPWERNTYNNIYSSLNKKPCAIIKEKRNQIKNNKLSFNWNTSNIFNKTEIEDIKAGEVIKNQIKTKYEIKYKYREPSTTVSSFISTRNETFLANRMIKILKEEKRNIHKKTEDYESSLKNENKVLDKDIDKFNFFTAKSKKKAQENELILLKVIADNKNLVDLYKKQLQEYNSTIYEVYKYIKIIINLKHYAAFIHKILGGDNDILHCELIENINFNDFKNLDIFSITKNIINNTQNLINDNSSNNYDNLDLANPATFNIFNFSFKSLEEQIINTFIKKQEYISDKDEIVKKGRLDGKEKKMRCEELNKDYEVQLQELDNKEKDYKRLYLTPEERENIEFNYELLKDIYSSLFGRCHQIKEIKKLKAHNANDMIKDVVSPIIREINTKEEKVNDMIKIMEENEKENKIIFNKVLNRRKIENRALKIINEKELIQIKENIRRKKYNGKMKKITIKGRYKYNYPTTYIPIKKNSKSANKFDMNISDFNLLTYQ